MSRTGIVARPHAGTKFVGSAYVGEVPGLGDEEFSAFATARLLSDDDPGTDTVIVGNKDGANGWVIGRAGGRDTAEFIFLFVSIGDTTYYIPLARAVAVGATFFVLFSLVESSVSVTLNGAQVTTLSGVAYSPSGRGMRVAGDLGGFGDLGSQMDVIACGFTEDDMSSNEIAELWNNVRQHSLYPATTWEYVWEVLSLYPQDGLGVTAPGNWSNTGTAGNAGDLSFSVSEGGSDTLDFSTDRCAWFGSAMPERLWRASRGFSGSRLQEFSGDIIADDAGCRVDVDSATPTTQTVLSDPPEKWLNTDIVTVMVYDAAVTFAGAGVVAADGFTLVSLDGPCMVQIARQRNTNTFLVYGHLVPE